jgi:DNA-binding MarR family transcriptional regulator
MDNQSKFCIELKSLVNSICRKMAQQPFRKGKDTYTTMQIWIIHYLYDNQDKDVFQRDLENDFNVRRSTVSGILQNLEKKGLIQRQSVAQDARLKKITLTEKANDIYNEMLIDIISMEQLMTENITDEEWTVFYQVLEKIKQNLE